MKKKSGAKVAAKKAPGPAKTQEPEPAPEAPAPATDDLSSADAASVDAQADELLEQIKAARVGVSDLVQTGSNVEETSLNAALAGMQLVQTDANLNSERLSDDSLGQMASARPNHRRTDKPVLMTQTASHQYTRLDLDLATEQPGAMDALAGRSPEDQAAALQGMSQDDLDALSANLDQVESNGVPSGEAPTDAVPERKAEPAAPTAPKATAEDF